MKQTQVHAVAADGEIITRALFKAAGHLAVKQKSLGRVLGENEATISRLKSGQKILKPASKQWEAALLFIRLFRSLDALMGSDDEASRDWLTSFNHDLAGVPSELIRTLQGLVHVVDYLDGFRARV